MSKDATKNTDPMNSKPTPIVKPKQQAAPRLDSKANDNDPMNSKPIGGPKAAPKPVSKPRVRLKVPTSKARVAKPVKAVVKKRVASKTSKDSVVVNVTVTVKENDAS